MIQKNKSNKKYLIGILSIGILSLLIGAYFIGNYFGKKEFKESGIIVNEGNQTFRKYLDFYFRK